MNENQLKRALADMHIKDDMQQRLIDNCTYGNENNITERRPVKMKKFNKAAILVASLAVLVVGFATTAYGQAIYEKVREIVLGGYAQYSDIDSNGETAVTLENDDEISITTTITIFTNVAETQPYLDFDLKIPVYLPDGYVLDRIGLFTAANGEISGEYASVYFTKGEKYIYLQTRLMGEDTAFSAELGNLEEVEINGYKGLLGKQNLDVDIDGVMYMFSTGSADIDSSELIKMVESYID